MTTKHTPGVWQIALPRGNGTAHAIWRNDEGPDAPDDAPNTNHKTIARDIHVSADAALIAAAPDLLAALVAMTGAIHPQADNSPFIAGLLDAADAAIAKATGIKESEIRDMARYGDLRQRTMAGVLKAVGAP